MKKFFILLFSALLLLSLSACGQAESDSSSETEAAASGTPQSISALYEAGYTDGMSTLGDNRLCLLFSTEAQDSFYRVTAELSDEQVEQYNSISVFDEDSDEQTKEFLCSLTDAAVEDISDMLPSQADMDAYIGKTVGDLVQDGFTENGYSWGESEGQFFMDNTLYECMITVEGNGGVENPDQLSEEEKESLVIKAAEFTGFSWGVLE